MVYVEETVKNAYRVPQPEGRGDYVRLDQNENPDGLPEWLVGPVMERVTPEFLSVYPEETKPTVKYAKLLGLKKENVTLTAGSTVGMGYVIKVFGEPGKDILTVTPSFAMYEVYAKMKGMKVKNLEYEEDFSYKVENTLKNIDDNTGIVVLVNPNMPVGNVYTQEEIENIVLKAREKNALVIIDEAYYYFFEKTAIDMVSKYDNVVVLRTFSKMLSMPSLRLGVIISNPEIIRFINNYKPHYTVNSVALLFCEAIADNHDRLLAELTSQYEDGKEYITMALADNGYEYISSAGCYICIRPKHKSAHELTDLLKENNILILCGKGGLTGWLRLTIAHKKYMELFMKTLMKIDKE